jgi:hypothetical protein
VGSEMCIRDRMDNAWTYNRISGNPGYKIDMTVYSIENKTNYETDYNYFTEFKPEKINKK